MKLYMLQISGVSLTSNLPYISIDVAPSRVYRWCRCLHNVQSLHTAWRKPDLSGHGRCRWWWLSIAICKQLEYLRSVTHMYFDATFKVVPSIYCQLLIIFVLPSAYPHSKLLSSTCISLDWNKTISVALADWIRCIAYWDCHCCLQVTYRRLQSSCCTASIRHYIDNVQEQTEDILVQCVTIHTSAIAAF